MQTFKTNVYELLPIELENLIDAEIAEVKDGICNEGFIEISIKYEGEEQINVIGYLPLDENWVYDFFEISFFCGKLTTGTYKIDDYDLIVRYVSAKTDKDQD